MVTALWRGFKLKDASLSWVLPSSQNSLVHGRSNTCWDCRSHDRTGRRWRNWLYHWGFHSYWGLVNDGAEPGKISFNGAATYPTKPLLSPGYSQGWAQETEGGETSSFPRDRPSPGACLPLERSGRAITLPSLISTDLTIPRDFHGQRKPLISQSFIHLWKERYMTCTADEVYPPQGQPALLHDIHCPASSKRKPLHPPSATEAL